VKELDRWRGWWRTRPAGDRVTNGHSIDITCPGRPQPESSRACGRSASGSDLVGWSIPTAGPDKLGDVARQDLLEPADIGAGPYWGEMSGASAGRRQRFDHFLTRRAEQGQAGDRIRDAAWWASAVVKGRVQ
jgi:hypothetical protein